MPFSLAVIPPGIGGIQSQGREIGLAVHGFWVPALPAGTTAMPKLNGIGEE